MKKTTLNMFSKTPRQLQYINIVNHYKNQHRVPAYMRKTEHLLNLLRAAFINRHKKQYNRHMVQAYVINFSHLLDFLKVSQKITHLFLRAHLIKKISKLLNLLKTQKKKEIIPYLERVLSYVNRIKRVLKYAEIYRSSSYFPNSVLPIVFFHKQQQLQSRSVVPGEVCFVRGPKGSSAYKYNATKVLQFISGKLSFSQMLKLYESSMYERGNNKTWKFILTKFYSI